ncbi:MAG TPA: TolC family protein, partial [Burkholderiales bacterium]|nr:TolC family protein [Burkholderiales bacterium]
MQLKGWGRSAACAIGLLAFMSCAWGQFLGPDLWHTEGKVSPAPQVPWQPAKPLPPVPAPHVSAEPVSAAPLTLAELTEYALRNNPRARQAWFAARAAAAGVGVEQADLLPQITGLISGSRVRPVSATTGSVSPWQNRYGPSVTLSYVLFDAARSDQIDAAEFRLLAANLTQNRVLQDIVFQVEQAYYRLMGLDLLVRVNELSLKNLRTSFDAANRRRESGLATVADVYRAETQVAQAELNLTRSRGELEKARGQLAAAVGLPVNQTLKVQTFTELPQVQAVSASLDNLLERARKTRPDLIAAEAQARAARSTAEAASKAGLPTVEITGAAGRTFFTDDRAPASNFSIGLNLRIPIFNGFRDRYTARLAEAQAAQAEASRDTLYRQTELDVWQAYYDVKTAASGIGSTDVQVKSAEQTSQA